jgi:hypothetical protein
VDGAAAPVDVAVVPRVVGPRVGLFPIENVGGAEGAVVVRAVVAAPVTLGAIVVAECNA